MTVRVGVSLIESRFDSEFSFIVESQLKVDSSQSWCFRCPYCCLASVKREFNVHVLLKGHTDDLPLSWELSLTYCLFDSVPFKFLFAYGHSEDWQKKATFRPFLVGILRWGACQVLQGVPLECDPGLYHAFPCLLDLGMKGKVYGTCCYSWNCDLTWS